MRKGPLVPHRPEFDSPVGDTRAVVLIIDDSADVHRLLRARLKIEDLTFISAGDGTEGLREATRTPAPSLILLDLDMPGVNGFETLKKLKDTPATVSIPVIVLSGSHGVEDKVRAFELGAVDYITKPFEFTELRARVSAALRTQRLLEMLAQRAQIDGLTGLWNRECFDRRWSEEFSRTQRRGHKLAVALLDIDHFKKINDTFGHPAGDAVLQGVARVLQRECRASDLACRYGGEEFVLLMPETDAKDAAKVCERIRFAVQSIVWARHPEHTVTISAGVAAGTAGLSAAEWLEIADKNLYAAKNDGRNRVQTTDVTRPDQLRYRKAG